MGAIVGDGRRHAYSVLRVIIALAVSGFFAWAGIDAARQLRERGAELDAQIELLQSGGASVGDDGPGVRGGSGARGEIERLRAQQLTLANFDWSRLLGAAVVYAVALIASAGFWHACLLAFGQHLSFRLALAAHVLGQAGKYVPGKAMVVVLRASAVARHAGVSRVAAAIGVFVETLTMMACGAALAGIAVLWMPTENWVRLLAVALAIGAAVPTLPPLFRLVVARLARSRFGSAVPFEADVFGWALMLRGWLWMAVVWVLIGLSFWLVVGATPGAAAEAEGASGYATAMATMCLAMVAGFLSLIPGGAGVRELVITTVLAPTTGAGPALVAAVLVRLVFLVTEAIVVAAAWIFLQRYGRR